MTVLETIITFSSWSMIITGAITFIVLFLVTAPYGRYSPNENSGR